MRRWALGRTLKRWKVYVLNYFEHRTTNAYTEGVHTKITLLKRASYGLRNIEAYVKKKPAWLRSTSAFLFSSHLLTESRKLFDTD